MGDRHSLSARMGTFMKGKDDPFALAARASLSSDPFKDAASRTISKSEPLEPKVSAAEAVLRAAAQGATFNFSDELWANIKSLSSDESYDSLVKSERVRNAAAEKQWPKTYLGSEVASSLLVPVPGLSVAKLGSGAAKVGKILTKTKPGKSLGKYKSDIAAGALSGAGASEGETLSDSLSGAASGYLFGKASRNILKKVDADKLKNFGINTLRVVLTGGKRDQVNHQIREYLKRSGAINSSMSRVDIKNKMDEVYEDLKDAAERNKDVLLHNSKAVHEELDLARSGLKEAKKREVTNLSEAKSDLKSFEPPDISEELIKAVKKTRQKAGSLAKEASKQLDADKVVVSSSELVEPVRKRVSELKIGGKIPRIKEARQANDELVSLVGELKKTGDLSAEDALKLRRQLDHLGNGSAGLYNKSAAEGPPSSVREGARSDILRVLRKKLRESGGSKYSKKMSEASDLFDLLDSIRDKKILPEGRDASGTRTDKTRRFIKSLSGSEDSKKILEVLDKATGGDLSQNARPYVEMQDFVRSRKVPSRDTLDKIPELYRLINSEKKLRGLQSEPTVKSTDLTDRKKTAVDFVKRWGTGDIEDLLSALEKSKGLSKASDKRLERSVPRTQSQTFIEKNLRRDPLDPLREDHSVLDFMSSELNKKTGGNIDLSQALRDRQTFESFLKEYTNGSRRTLLFRTLLAPTGRVGEALGAALGFTVDTEGATMLKKALDSIISAKKSPTVRQMADKLYPALKFLNKQSQRPNIGHAMNLQYVGGGSNEEG